jgi:autotransporter adhesin
MTLVVDDRNGNSSQLNVTATTIDLTQNGSGMTTTGGATKLTGTTSTAIAGGSTQMLLTASGANFSGSGGAPVRVSGVADGVAPTDAVNVRQLGALESQLSAAIAGTMAMSQLPGISGDENYSFGVSVGGYNGEAAFALGGMARLDRNIILQGAAQYCVEGGVGAALGVGWSW